MPDRYVLVVAGGRGERFWPWSRPERPKQLLPLARGGRSLLAATFERALGLVPRDHVIVMTASDLVPEVRRECPGATVVGEPLQRNTGPAVAAAAAWVEGDRSNLLFDWLPESASWIRRHVIKHSWVKGFHVHRLRHSFACSWLERGGSVEGLQRILGHSTITLTERYGKLRPHVVAAEMARVDVATNVATAASEPSEPRKSLRSW